MVNTTTIGANFINYPSSTATLITNTNYKNQELRNEYAYDEFNQLAQSYFETYNNSSQTITNYSHYQESGSSGAAIAYDKNGNITRLIRNATGSTVLDDLTYTIGGSNNQLSAIKDAAVNTIPASVNYRTPSTSSASNLNYNAIGQLTVSVPESISSINYFPNGKIKKITFSNGNSSEFEYGAMGEKLKSRYRIHATNKAKYIWYIGPYVYEFDSAGVNTFTIKEAKVSGGVIRVSSGTNIGNGYMVYHLSDHLGNVRVSFTKKTGTNSNGTGIDVLSYNDYYAFGGILPGRSYSMENYRYAYQGQEKAEDGTVWDQFELRSYNHDLGRWFSPDPYGQFASPYLAMGNNPVSNIDPDGGYSVAEGNYKSAGYRERQNNNFKPEYSEDNEETYASYIQRAKDRYLDGKDSWVDGQLRDVSKYLEEVQKINTYYLNMGYSNVSVGANTDYLTNSEIALYVPELESLALVSKDGAQGDPSLDPRQPDDSWRVEQASEYIDGKRNMARADMMFPTTSVNKIMDQNGNDTGHRTVTTHNTDGSETIVEYDINGELRADGSPAIDHISFRTAEQVAERNGRVAGSSFDSYSYNYGGSTPQDFRIYTKPDAINMSSNPDGNLVVHTLIAAFQFENANPNGGQSRPMRTYLQNAANVSFNYPSINFEHRGGKFQMSNLTLSFDGAGNVSWSSPGNGIAPLNQQFNEALGVRDAAFLNWQGQPTNNTAPLFSNYPPGFTFLPN